MSAAARLVLAHPVLSTVPTVMTFYLMGIVGEMAAQSKRLCFFGGARFTGNAPVPSPRHLRVTVCVKLWYNLYDRSIAARDWPAHWSRAVHRIASQLFIQ